MKHSPRYAVSTAKFKKSTTNCVDTTTSLFDENSNQIQQLYEQIDDLIEQINKRQPKIRKQEDDSSKLIKELQSIKDELQDASQDCVFTISKLKKAINNQNNQIRALKQELFRADTELKLYEEQNVLIQDKQQQYAQQLLKLKDKQQSTDSISRYLDQNGISHWHKIKQMFDVEVIKTMIPIGQLIRLQIILLKEVDNLLEQDKYPKLQEEKKQLLIEINTQHPLILLILSFDQIVLNIIHQTKDTNISKQLLLSSLQKCLILMHQNFCQLAQSLNKLNISQRLYEEWSYQSQEIQQNIRLIQQKKSQYLIEMDRVKKKLKELQTEQQNKQQQQQNEIDLEAQNLLIMYLKDKENLMRDIKFKYGKQYHDHMIQDVKGEFKQICLQQQQEKMNILEQMMKRQEDIQQILSQNQSKTQEISNQSDKREYLLQLQNMKIQLLQFENKLNKKIQTDQSTFIDKMQTELSYLKKQIDDNFILIKHRSDSIDTVKRRIETKESIHHHRSQSQVPSVNVQLLNLQLPINNPNELFESTEDPIQSIKQPMTEWNSYQLSFNQNPLKSISNISAEQSQQQSFHNSTMKNSILESMRSSNVKQNKENCQQQLNELPKQQQNDIILLLSFGDSQKQYDPIKNYEEDPRNFGYQLFRIDENFNIYSPINDNDENTFNQFIKKIDVKQIKLDSCSEQAIRFQRIYEPSIRQICQESVALRHLKVRFYPFFILGEHTIKGLTMAEEDLEKLQKLVK